MNAMTDAERSTLAAYDTSGQHDKAQEYYDSMLSEWRRRGAQYDYAETKYRAESNKLQGAAENILGAPAQTGAYLATAGQAVKNLVTGRDDMVDPNSPWMKGVRRTQATSEGVTEGMGGVGKFLTQTGLSIGQYATKLPFGQFALLAMGLEVAGAKSYDVARRGGSAGEALLIGTAAGAIEAITEKLPLDGLLKIGREGVPTARAALSAVLKQSGVEATEEMISEIANNVVDLSVMGERSEVQQFAEQLMLDGMPREQAENKALAQYFVWNTAQAGLAGALSGGVMAGAGTLVGNADMIGDPRYQHENRGETDPRYAYAHEPLPQVEDAEQNGVGLLRKAAEQ
ncbi:MAG: hypothetical protein EOM69_12895, partial [Clostridia bacterium]|nr:hypothetical protein [Clostridia bacterium]